MSILISFLYLYIVTFYILFFTVVCCNSTLFTFICFGIFCIRATLPWVWAPSFGFKHNSNWAHFMINAGAHPTSHILSVRWLLWRCNLYKTWWWLRVSGFLTCWVTHGSWRAAMCTLLLHYSARYRMFSPPPPGHNVAFLCIWAENVGTKLKGEAYLIITAASFEF